jgi:hypothetical protein
LGLGPYRRLPDVVVELEVLFARPSSSCTSSPAYRTHQGERPLTAVACVGFDSSDALLCQRAAGQPGVLLGDAHQEQLALRVFHLLGDCSRIFGELAPTSGIVQSLRHCHPARLSTPELAMPAPSWTETPYCNA